MYSMEDVSTILVKYQIFQSHYRNFDLLVLAFFFWYLKYPNVMILKMSKYENLI